MSQPRPQVLDRRVKKTRKVLRDALNSLIHEKSYDSIAVQEILNRANVGRSTFYTHYRDKDALLASNIHDMLDPDRPREAAPGARHERLLSFSLPIFQKLDRHLREGNGRIVKRGRSILHEHLRKAIAESIAEDLASDPGVGDAASRIPSDLLARYLASTFVLVLNWWVQSESRLGPNEADDLYKALVSRKF